MSFPTFSNLGREPHQIGSGLHHRRHPNDLTLCHVANYPHVLYTSPRTFNHIARKRSGIQGYPRDRHGHDRYLEFEPAVLVPVSSRSQISVLEARPEADLI